MSDYISLNESILRRVLNILRKDISSEEEFEEGLKESGIESLEFSTDCIEGVFYRSFYLIFDEGEFQLSLNGENEPNWMKCGTNINESFRRMKLSISDQRELKHSKFIKFLSSRSRDMEFIKQRQLRH